MQKILFGAGCFWGVEEAFKKLNGVVDTKVGYSGGDFPDPTYKDVCRGDTGHAEVVQVTFDPNVITLKNLLDHFWQLHNPTTLNRQGPDIGDQYRSAIFCYSPEDMLHAKNSMESRQKDLQDPIVTQIEIAKEFYEAEEYHQCYFEKNK